MTLASRKCPSTPARRSCERATRGGRTYQRGLDARNSAVASHRSTGERDRRPTSRSRSKMFLEFVVARRSVERAAAGRWFRHPEGRGRQWLGSGFLGGARFAMSCDVCGRCSWGSGKTSDSITFHGRERGRESPATSWQRAERLGCGGSSGGEDRGARHLAFDVERLVGWISPGERSPMDWPRGSLRALDRPRVISGSFAREAVRASEVLVRMSSFVVRYEPGPIVTTP